MNFESAEYCGLISAVLARTQHVLFTCFPFVYITVYVNGFVVTPGLSVYLHE